MYKHTQRSFAGGFLDASLMGRQDLQKYFTGSSRLDNFRVRRQGCISKRSGTDFVADLSKLTQKFNSSNYRTFAGMRLFPLVDDASGGFYLLFVTYNLDHEEDYTDSAGSTAKRTRETRIYVAGPEGVLLAESHREVGRNWTRSPIAWSSDSLDTAYWVDSDFENFTATGVGEIDLFQSGDTVFAAHPSRPPRVYKWKKSSLTLTAARMNFSHSATAAPTLSAPGNNVNPETISVQYSGKLGDGDTSLTVTKVKWEGGQKKTGVKVYLPVRAGALWTWNGSGETSLDQVSAFTKTVSYVATAVKDGLESNPSAAQPLTYYLPWPQEGRVVLTATVPTGSNAPERVNFYKKQSSGYGFIGYAEPNGSSTVTFVDDYITPDMSVTPPYNDESPFKGAGSYPSCVGTYQQRLVFASSNNKPMGFWMSAIGDIYNFSPHESYREDDMIAAELAAIEMPKVNHVVVNRDLLMFADAAEWRIAPASGNALTYKTVSAKMQSQVGCARSLKPMAIADEVVFSERTRKTLRAIGYSYSSDGYESQDLSVLSQDYFDKEITSMCHRQHPDSEIVCCMSDGTLRILAYMREHEVVAWSRHVLGDDWKAQAVASNKSVSNGATDVALVVQHDKRDTTDGEQWELWRMRTDRSSGYVQNRVCMDGVVTGTFKDFNNTAGKALFDWLVNSGRKVWRCDLWQEVSDYDSAGQVSDAIVFVAGWTFSARWASVRPEPQGGGNIQFEVKNAKDMEVRVLDGGAWDAAPYGGLNAGSYIPQKVDPGVSVSEGRVTLDTSDHTVLLSGANSGDGRVEIRSTDAWPLTILSVSTNYEIHPLSDSEG